eukprot:TRINITY_DN11306_c0_g1_i1.p2 TRINITY_DN11306_c0_g1~~TRINITY_DN11306_c0_g1_i1.p2  ORF type:complete len:163 (+),score=71.26 TRINITY_DN11306_c0_g1_i1:63-491(+)
MSGDGKEEPQLSQEELQGKYSYMKQEYEQYAMKIAEMEGEKHEYNLVLTALEPLEDDRKCYRLVGGVLVERTANEVKPALKESIVKIDEVLEKLNAAAASKQKELQEFTEKHKISRMTAGNAGGQQPAQTEKKESKSTGVLA